MESHLKGEAMARSAPVGMTAGPAQYKWWVVFMLWFICFFNYADRQAIFSVFPKLKEEFGFDKVQLGLIGAAFMWGLRWWRASGGYVGDRVAGKTDLGDSSVEGITSYGLCSRCGLRPIRA